MIPIEIGKVLIDRQMEQVHKSLGMEPGNALQHQATHYPRKKYVLKFSEWLGAAFIDFGNTLVRYAHKHEAVTP